MTAKIDSLEKAGTKLQHTAEKMSKTSAKQSGHRYKNISQNDKVEWPQWAEIKPTEINNLVEPDAEGFFKRN